MTSKSTSPATGGNLVPATSGYLATIGNPDMAVALRENLDPNGSVLDLPSVRVPAGGMTLWTVDTLEGPQTVKEIEGVILHRANARAYWPKGLGEGGDPVPSCASADGRRGIGTPGGDCSVCPFNQFGTAKDGTAAGKACREAIALLVLVESQALPIRLVVPTMSMKPINAYFMRLASNGKPFHAVVSAFRLVQARNATGITFSTVEPRFVRNLSADERAGLEGYRAAVLPAFNATRLEAVDVS